MVKKFDDNLFSCFDTAVCDGRMDRHTDRHLAIAYSRYAIIAR